MIVPIFRNENNMMKFPQCVSYDIKKQVGMVVLYSLRTVLLQRCTSWLIFFETQPGARAGDGGLPDPRTHQGPHTSAVPPGDPESQTNCWGFPQILNEKGSGEIVHEEKRVRESDGKEVKTLKINSLSFYFLKVNTLLKNNIEGIILKWSYQVSMASPFSNDMNNNNK